MDRSLTTREPTVRESRFRTPLPIERELGLWVDRIGSGSDGSRGCPMRILGQYAAVAITSGSGIYKSMSTGEFRVQEGDVIILTPHQAAAYWPEPAWQTCWVVWNGQTAEQLERLAYLDPAVPVIRHAAPAVARVHAILRGLMQKEDRASVLARMEAVLSLVVALYRAQVINSRSHAVHDVGERAVTYIQNHYAQELPVGTLARQLGMSASHFRRLFKSYSGQSPSEYIASVRIARAKELLAAGASIKESADAVGYADSFYFMRIFKKVAGITPGAFAAQQHSRAEPAILR